MDIVFQRPSGNTLFAATNHVDTVKRAKKLVVDTWGYDKSIIGANFTDGKYIYVAELAYCVPQLPGAPVCTGGWHPRTEPKWSRYVDM